MRRVYITPKPTRTLPTGHGCCGKKCGGGAVEPLCSWDSNPEAEEELLPQRLCMADAGGSSQAALGLWGSH